eukprot:scaffold693669_cov47-Attheya_sp.AAC.1
MGTQEPAEKITQVGVAFWWGLALADLVLYTPLLAVGLVGHWLDRQWGIVVLAGALGITIYWPLVCLATIWSARDTPHWSLPKERQYWVILKDCRVPTAKLYSRSIQNVGRDEETMITFKGAEGTMMRMSGNATHAGTIHKGTQKHKSKIVKDAEIGWLGIK